MDVSKPPSCKGRPREFDAEKALECAMRVFWRKGYLGTSISDLTDALEINRPSLYAAFGNKESLFRKVLTRYAEGPAGYLSGALSEPTARGVAGHLLQSAVELATHPKNPGGCLWVTGALSCGEPTDLLRKEIAAQRSRGESALVKRFKQAIVDDDLPNDSDPVALARFLGTISFGISVQAAAGATRAELMRVVKIALQAWPK